MTSAGRKYACVGILVSMVFGAGSIAGAQTTQNPWSVEFGLGWDNDITGDIIAGGIGKINGQNVVMLKSTYEDVYGTGLHVKGGVGYMLPGSTTELRATLAFQSLGAAIVTPLGDIGVSRFTASSRTTRACRSTSASANITTRRRASSFTVKARWASGSSTASKRSLWRLPPT